MRRNKEQVTLYVDEIEAIATISNDKKMPVCEVTEMYLNAIDKFGRNSQLEKITSFAIDLALNGLSNDEAIETAGVILNDDYPECIKWVNELASVIKGSVTLEFEKQFVSIMLIKKISEALKYYTSELKELYEEY